MSDLRRTERARVVARAVLANLESLREGGLDGAGHERVVDLCRSLAASRVCPEQLAGVLLDLQRLLVPVRGLAARTFAGWLDDLEPPHGA